MTKFSIAWTVLLVTAASRVTCFPTDTSLDVRGSEDTEQGDEELPMLGVLSEDKKHTLTYLLGQPKKGGGAVSSPAELLSPDRYEFYTFDDDGQIVKKLMSVREIQKIIANNNREPGTPDDAIIPPIEYYQILTVSPDVESLPNVNRINPNEPLFSIHDVIASVQNVLRSEIKTKQTQPPPAVLLPIGATKPTTPSLTSVTEPTVQAVTENTATTPDLVKSPSVHKINATIFKPTESTTSKPKNTQPPPLTTVRVTNKTKVVASTTPITTTKTKVTSTTPLSPNKLKLTATTYSTSKTTKKPISTTPVIRTRKPSTTPTSTTSTTTTTAAPKTTLTTTTRASITEAAMSLEDAHPGLMSNLTESELETLGEEIYSGILGQSVNYDIELTTTEDPEAETERTTESLDDVRYTQSNNASAEGSIQNMTVPQAISQVQIPINQDLAESVSSVLSQIASEISMSSNMDFETGLIRSTQETDKEVKIALNDSDDGVVNITTTEGNEETTTQTGLPASWLKATENIFELGGKEESTTIYEEVQETTTPPIVIFTFKPQNDPRPFQKVPISENLIAAATNTRLHLHERINKTEVKSTTVLSTPEKVTVAPSSSTSETTARPISKETPEITKPTPEAVTEIDELEKTGSETLIQQLSHESTTIVTTLSYDDITLPEGDLEVTTLLPARSVNSSIEANETLRIQVVQEGDTGRIPRPTQNPDILVESLDVSGEVTTEEVPVMEFHQSLSSANEAESNVESTTEGFIAETTTLTPESTTLSEPEVTTENEDEAGITESSESIIDFSFVPMMIKSTLGSSSSTNAPQTEFTTNTSIEKEMTTVTDNQTTMPDTTTEAANITETEDLESKILPEGGVELKHDVPVQKVATSTVTAQTQKTTEPAIAQKDASASSVSELKQNAPNKPYFTKPQKPVFIKPSKVKPQHESKPAKPLPEPSRKPIGEKKRPYESPVQSAPSPLELDVAPDENLGLEATTANLEVDVRKFADLCNELAFSLWSSITHNGLSFVRSVVISPFSVTSLLAMVFLGARGPTSGQMNDVLKLDDMVTFNPHLVFRNVTESLVISRNPGVATAAFVRELYSDKAKGKLLEFYKERAQQFYDGHVEEVNFKTIGDTLRRATNHLVKRQTWGKITDFLRGSTLVPRSPLAAFGANVFQTDCSHASTKDRDGEMYFVILPSSRLRRLVPIPAVVWRDGFLAGYEPGLDATAVSIGPTDSVVSTVLVLPGQQGLIAPGDSLARLEHHLLGASFRRGHWTRLMRSLLPRPGLELQIPRLSHKSVINVTTSLQKMGLKDLFSAEKADLTGLNGIANDLHLSDMLQVNLFSTCGEEPIGARHHSEVYPASPLVRRDKSADNPFSESLESLFAVSDFEDPSVAAMPLELRPRQARIPEGRVPEPPRLRFDRPFLFFVRHNPTGLILHMGRFNPRLTP